MSGSWFTTIHKTLGHLHSDNFAKGLNMSPWLPQPPDADSTWVQQEQDAWSTAWTLNVELASARPKSNVAKRIRDVFIT